MPEPMPPFWKRLLLLPFNPMLVAEARSWSVGAILGPMVLLALVLSGGLGLYRGIDFTMKLKEGGRTFDGMADPIVIERGVLRVEGTRLFRYEEAGTLFLVDPEETVPEAELPARFVVARRNSLIDNQQGRRRETKLLEVTSVLKMDLIRIDGATVTAWANRWATSFALGMTALMVVFEGFGLLATLLYALLCGLVLGGMWGKSRGLSGGATFNVALAALAGKSVVGVVLALLGTGVGFCWGILVWPAVAIGLGSFALSRLPVAEPPPPGPSFATPG